MWNFLIIFFLLITAGCGWQDTEQKTKAEPCKYDYVILESLIDQNKPIPVLAFYDSLIKNPKSFIYAKNFALSGLILCEIGRYANSSSDTFQVKGHFPLYLIRILVGGHEEKLYRNTEAQLKGLFDGLETVLKEHNLYQPFKAVYDIRDRLNL